jgi:CRP/FNR family transcriptional regulator
MTNIIELLSSKEKNRLNIRKLTKGETLFHEDDLCEEIGILIRGKLLIASYLEDGREMIYNTIEEGMIFGNNLLFSSSPYYKGDITAETESELCLIRKADLLEILKNNEAFLLAYLKIQSDLGKALNQRIRLLSIASARERFLFYLHEQHGLLQYESITRLSKDLYLSREVLSRLISVLTKEKIIIKDNKTIRLL